MKFQNPLCRFFALPDRYVYPESYKHASLAIVPFSSGVSTSRSSLQFFSDVDLIWVESRGSKIISAHRCFGRPIGLFPSISMLTSILSSANYMIKMSFLQFFHHRCNVILIKDNLVHQVIILLLDNLLEMKSLLRC